MAKKVFCFSLDIKTVELLDEYRRKCNKIPSRSKAIEDIIRGLQIC